MDTKDRIKNIQKRVGVTADGIIGPKTLAAIEAELDIAAPAGVPTQAEVRSGKSIYGKAGDESNLVNLTPPYPLFYQGKAVKSIRVHKAIAEKVEAALADVLTTYGRARIHELGLDVYDGAFNNRSVRGGTATSMHAWGIAIDFDAAHNGNNVHAPAARFSGSEYGAWFDIWERHGAVSLGRARDRDYMHIQFARL